MPSNMAFIYIYIYIRDIYIAVKPCLNITKIVIMQCQTFSSNCTHLYSIVLVVALLTDIELSNIIKADHNFIIYIKKDIFSFSYLVI